MKIFTIAIGSDHAGFTYKGGHQGRPAGRRPHGARLRHQLRPASCDYPDFIRPTAEAVARGDYERGIVLGGSGNGEAIVANRVRGVRCGLCWTEQVAIWSRAHNDANVLSHRPAHRSRVDEAVKIVRTWLVTDFEGGRHLARIRKIDGV